MTQQFARQTAIPCTIAELKAGEWVQQGGMLPSGVRTARGFLARVNILAVIVDKHEDTSLLVDDGSATMRVRTFETTPVPVHAEIGDIVMIIGRPRDYNGERYLLREICRKITNPGWVEYRKKELANFHKYWVEETAPPIQQTVTVVSTREVEVVIDTTAQKNPFERLIDAIREFDTGSGASVDDVLAKVPHEESQKLLRTLIEEGEIFEIRPGRVKVLE